MISIEVVVNCSKCKEKVMLTIPEYLSYLYHTYLLRIPTGLFCEECFGNEV